MRSCIIVLCFLWCFGVSYGTLPYLDVEWNFFPWKSDRPNAMPRTIREAEQQDFRGLGSCTHDPTVNGIPYRRDTELNITLLFDVRGNIAGIQIEISSFQFSLGVGLGLPFVLKGDHYFLTVYFMDPSIICTIGGPNGGDSYKLFLQLDPSPLSAIEISLKEDALDLKKWTKGMCVNHIGKHYWFLKRGEIISCRDSAPFFIVFNDGEVTSIGFSLISTVARATTPVILVLRELFLGAVPTCMVKPTIVDYVYIFVTRQPSFKTCLW